MAEQSMKVNTRAVILDALMLINENDEYSHLVVQNVLRKYQYLSAQERSFMLRIIMGTVERKLTLDFYLDQISKTPVKKMKPLIRNLLRMSAYQICYMDSVEDYAVCNEAVKLANKRGFSNLKGFVNGVLRNLAREYGKISLPTLSVKYSTPQWLVDAWVQTYGEEKAEEILKSQFENRPLWIRANTLKVTPDELERQLIAAGVEVHRDKRIAEAMTIAHFDYLEGLEAWQEGLFFVQDYSSMQVAYAAEIQDGMHIIDVCAAPGGKSTHLAQRMHGTGRVEARDLTQLKVELIEENVERLGLKNVEPMVWDATICHEASLGQADLVIADLPCSGLGILNKKPDIKYHASEKQCSDLVALQRQILSVVAGYVKPGGTLIYSTCTIHKGENEENAVWISNQTNLHLKFIDEKQYLPGEALQDGFYIAKFVKES